VWVLLEATTDEQLLDCVLYLTFGLWGAEDRASKLGLEEVTYRGRLVLNDTNLVFQETLELYFPLS
jgi:hypothetical protein